ncbi:aspartyl/glutamyl-tRNA amidotransferase subunit A [Candidatus Pacearchaeota archaeon]|nr:aspartyl/glutamyl-tRNA amidotransferase subunit A [Candidatus Pacearchaeota archaeon]
MNKILKEAKKINREYNTFITINESFSEGIPIVVKDNICTLDLKTTAGSKILENYVPIFDATVIKKLKEKNFSVLGKTTQDAFGFGTFSTNTELGIPKNPFDKNRSCGGSSGGTAAYIKLSENVKYGLGQSTGGSINCPAAFCGVVGLTPTYGLVSRYGLIDYANSFDRIGPITKTVKDAAELLTIISGIDTKDPTTQNKNEDYTKYLNEEIKGIKIGIIKECFSEKIDENIKSGIKETIIVLEKKGCEIQEISIPITQHLVSAYYIIALAEASTNLAKYSGMIYGLEEKPEENYNEYFEKIRKNFSLEEKRRILLGTFVRMAGYKKAYYNKAIQIRNLAVKQFQEIFKKFDLLITPTMPILPPKFEEIEKLSPLQTYAMDFLTIIPSVTGLPSMSLPVKTKTKLPIGMQLIANHFHEKNLVKVGDAYEK